MYQHFYSTSTFCWDIWFHLKKKKSEVHLTITTWAVKLLSELLCNQQLNKGHDKRKPHRKELCVYIYIFIFWNRNSYFKSLTKNMYLPLIPPQISPMTEESKTKSIVMLETSVDLNSINFCKLKSECDQGDRKESQGLQSPTSKREGECMNNSKSRALRTGPWGLKTAKPKSLDLGRLQQLLPR